MSARKRQSGQALVAALATTALLFALAGGLAVAVSAALASTGSTADPYLRDSQAASATSAIMATVAGDTAACPSPSSVATSFGLGSNAFSCDRLDMVAPGQVAMVPFQWSGTCASAALAGTADTSLWLHAIHGLGAFYVDGNRDGCSPGAGACTASSTSSGPGAFYSIADCNLAAFGTPYAHVAGPKGSVSVVRLAPLASFVPAHGSPYAVDGAGPIASAALRGPGKPLDLVVGSRTTGTITVWLGNGDGTFRLAFTIPTPADVSALTLADLNDDAVPDLAFTSFQRNLVSVWLGNGDGTFRKSLDYSVGAGPVGVVAGPLTSPDGVVLATANSGDHTVSILIGVGGGRFANAIQCSVQGSPTALAMAGSANKSIYLAIPKVTAPGTLSVYSIAGNGSGGCDGKGNSNVPLVETQTYGLAGAPGAMTVAHFTSSGWPDLAAALPGQNQVQVLLGTGSGRFQVQAPFDVGDAATALAAAHFGSSPYDDLAVTKLSGAVTPLIGNGNGTFRPALGGDIAAGLQPAGVAAGDFDGSGTDGLAVTTRGDGQLSVLLQNRSRVFSVLASAPGGSAFNEADLIWANPTRTNTLFFEGGLR